MESRDSQALRGLRFEPQVDCSLHHQFRQQKEVGRSAAGQGGHDVERFFGRDPHHFTDGAHDGLGFRPV